MNADNPHAAPALRRWMVGERLGAFLRADPAAILGTLLQHSGGSVEPTQRNAWARQVEILQALESQHVPVFKPAFFLRKLVDRVMQRIRARFVRLPA